MDLTLTPDEEPRNTIENIDLTKPNEEADPLWRNLMDKGQILLELINTTAAWKHRACLTERAATVTMLTEHSIPKSKLAKFLNYVRKEGKNPLCTPTVPGGHVLGGVGSITTHARRAIEVKPKTEAFKKAIEKGKLGIVAVNLTKSKVLTYVVLYGHTGGRKDQKQADATDALLKIAHTELDAQPKGPKMIAGDLNADPSNLPFLQKVCETDGWTDVGEKTQMWGGQSCEHTCLGHNANQPTRNDYIIVNELCLPLVKGFRVLHKEGLLVHSVV